MQYDVINKLFFWEIDELLNQFIELKKEEQKQQEKQQSEMNSKYNFNPNTYMSQAKQSMPRYQMPKMPTHF